jgi:hypothetical protein
MNPHHFESAFGSNKNPDPHQIKTNPDPHQGDKSNPDPHQRDADPQFTGDKIYFIFCHFYYY